jgi:glycosyltransferase involved in cell wall biosynthesis
LTGLSDVEISAAYQLARFSVFPSFSEGFGLPVAESLALGTPVITSDFGSMKEIADAGGALQIDPRDDHALAAAIEQLLANDELLEQLRLAAARRPRRTWDDYARETWELLVDGKGSEREAIPQ